MCSAAAQIRLGSKVWLLQRDGSFERTQSWHPPLRFKCVFADLIGSFSVPSHGLLQNFPELLR